MKPQFILVIIAGSLSTGCGDTIKRRNSPSDSLATNRYVDLIRDEYTSRDPNSKWSAKYCEMSRLLRVYTSTHGQGYAVGMLRAAEDRAYRGIPDSMFEYHESQLPLTRAAVEDAECRALARAGVLGDTTYPPPPEFRP
jgi:hypothetical protein